MLLRKRDLVQRQLQKVRDGREQLERFAIVPPTAAEDFAIDGQPGQGAD